LKVIWTPRAASDLDGVVDYIGADSPDSAVRVAEKIYNHIMKLETMPHIGRKGVVPGTRELIFYPWPYIAVYRVVEDEVRIILIRHASQQWP
jgi:addiction module RelE/StbE family toxin